MTNFDPLASSSPPPEPALPVTTPPIDIGIPAPDLPPPVDVKDFATAPPVSEVEIASATDATTTPATDVSPMPPPATALSPGSKSDL